MTNFTLTNGNHSHLFKQLEALDPTERWAVSWKPWKSKRSLDQNARYWKLVTAFGEHVGYERDEMHQLMGYKFLRYEKICRDGLRRTFIPSTTKLNTAEMADYQERIERLAAQQGFIFDEG